MHMTTAITGARLLLGAAVLSTLCAVSTAMAAGHDVTVTIHLSTSGVDLSNPVDAQHFYRRIERAAEAVCEDDRWVGLTPVENLKACYEQSLADGIRSIKSTFLTQIYLMTHTLGEAASRGIEVPPQLAAK